MPVQLALASSPYNSLTDLISHPPARLTYPTDHPTRSLHRAHTPIAAFHSLGHCTYTPIMPPLLPRMASLRSLPPSHNAPPPSALSPQPDPSSAAVAGTNPNTTHQQEISLALRQARSTRRRDGRVSSSGASGAVWGLRVWRMLLSRILRTYYR